MFSKKYHHLQKKARHIQVQSTSVSPLLGKNRLLKLSRYVIASKKFSRSNTTNVADLVETKSNKPKSKALSRLIKESNFRRTSFHETTTSGKKSSMDSNSERSPRKPAISNRMTSNESNQYAKGESEESRNLSENTLEEFPGFWNKKKKQYLPTRRYSQDTKTLQPPTIERCKEKKKSTFYNAKNTTENNNNNEETEKNNSAQSSDSDNISCPDPQGFKISDCISDSLNESFTSYSSEKSYGISDVVLPVIRKSRFCVLKDLSKETGKEEISNSDEEKKSMSGLGIEREEGEENGNATLAMRRNKTDPPTIGTKMNKEFTVQNTFLDEQNAHMVQDIAKLKVKIEKNKTTIETYKFIGTTAKTLLNQVPYIKGKQSKIIYF